MLKLVVDNTQMRELDVDPQEMEELRNGFDNWMDQQGETTPEAEDIFSKVRRLREWCDNHERKMLERINRRS